MKKILTLTSLKYFVRKNKNKGQLKKILRERERERERESQLKEKLREMQKPICFEINKKEFEELTRDIHNNQDNNNFKLS